MTAKRGIFVAPFDELADPRLLMELAASAEELAAEASELRDDSDAPFDLVVEIEPGDDPAPWEVVGATWVLTAFDQSPVERDVRAAIEAAP